MAVKVVTNLMRHDAHWSPSVIGAIPNVSNKVLIIQDIPLSIGENRNGVRHSCGTHLEVFG
jgi:hypothetical protein